ncbi:MAG: YgiQ family radical SAM protein [Gammaproteobacteria bacterium]|nr:YgiQ family radical SAM protein [Gammaproteobacteria bacterium]MDD9896449.1 YgiQ family radical SAM protein [Gammaproteobacteria bacterium]MDD9958525.1 YgiQ family radical SAM protein [Gammaproteobacteria bacterium]
MSRKEMDALGWDSCDVIIVTADAYVDHPSFGMAVVGRLLEAQGFRVGIIAQPEWDSVEPFKALGKPNLFFGITGGNMDSLINRYTADLRIRSDDAYTPNAEPGKRPDRSVIVYSQRCREAYYETPIVIGGIEASLRRIAQYDYWSDKVRRSILVDANADILLFGNAERALAELAHQVANGKSIADLWDLRGSALLKKDIPVGWTEIDSTRIDWPAKIDKLPNPYDFHDKQQRELDKNQDEAVPVKIIPLPLQRKVEFDSQLSYIRLPSFNKVINDAPLYAHASRVLHQEANPYNGKVLVQKHGNQDVWVNPPPIPLETDEMDWVFDLPYQRKPHPGYGDARIPAYDMIKTSVNIMRGCFGGCTFCSITEHEGRIIQSRSEDSVIREIEKIRDQVPGFTGTISDLGGPTANMYKLNCKSLKIQKTCKRLSCVYPTICKHLNTDHSPTTQLYRKARAIPGIKRVAVASGLRYDLALKDPEYIKELVTHHVGGYLKIAPEHSEDKTLSKMMKPGISAYDEFKVLFDKFSKEAGKEQFLIPYFIAAHPGCDAEDMLNLSLWLKEHNFKPDQVQTFYPSPMALATAMYYSEKNPLEKVRYKSDQVSVCKDIDQRRLQKAFLRYHDEKNWPTLRKALINLGRSDLIGTGNKHLIPPEQRNNRHNTRKNSTRRRRT